MSETDPRISNILARLDALEAAVARVGHTGVGTFPTNQELEVDDRRLPAVAVAQRYGVVVRTLDRWLDDPELNFPEPEVLNHRRYWWLSELREWERNRAPHSSNTAMKKNSYQQTQEAP
jgi:hypothetical protein